MKGTKKPSAPPKAKASAPLPTPRRATAGGGAKRGGGMGAMRKKFARGEMEC